MSEPYTIYLAGELFDHKHLIGNAVLAEQLARHSGGRYVCCVPQDLEHPTERGVDVRDNDLKHVMHCDLGLFNFDGPDIDSGTAAEFMYAKALDIPAVILRSDLRERTEGEERLDWNLMCSFYPRTEMVRFNALELYREASRDSDTLEGRIETIYADVANRLVVALDAVRAAPSLIGPDRERIEAIYHWALRYPGGGLEPLAGGAGFVREVVERKLARGLL